MNIQLYLNALNLQPSLLYYIGKSVNYNISKFKVYDYYLQKIVDLLNNTNTWLHYNQVAFVVSMILVAFEESQNVRAYAGILLNNFVMYEIILKCSVHLG